MADPWVIGLAMARDLVVVTQETRPGSSDSPTIPRVCNHFGVEFVNTFEFMRREGWTF
jgi:MinD superfamily P-loop ATPase